MFFGRRRRDISDLLAKHGFNELEWRKLKIQAMDLVEICRCSNIFKISVKTEYERCTSFCDIVVQSAFNATAPNYLSNEHPSENDTSRRPNISQTFNTTNIRWKEHYPSRPFNISQTYDSKNGTFNLMKENVDSKQILIGTSALVLFMTMAIVVLFWFLRRRQKHKKHKNIQEAFEIELQDLESDKLLTTATTTITESSSDAPPLGRFLRNAPSNYRIDVDITTVTQEQTLYQESEEVWDNDVKFSVVRPLAAPAEEKNEDVTPPHLNWDAVFRYLAKNLPPSDWQLFFNILYGNCPLLLREGTDIGSYIGRVESNVRRNGGGIETLMFELFKTWKQLMGSDVNIACIIQALEERSHNIALADFRKFMRNPPLLPPIPNQNKSQSSFSLDVFNNEDNKEVTYFPLVHPNYTTFMLHSIPQHVKPPFDNRTHMITGGPIIEEIGDQNSDAPSLKSSTSSSIQTSGRDSTLSSGDPKVDRKRKIFTRDIQSDEKQVTPRKQRKKDKVWLPLKWNKCSNHNKYRRDEKSELHEMKQSMIEMTQQFLPLTEIPLQAKQYNVYLEHTIECIINETGEPRMRVLSLSHKDFCNKETFETNRNEKFYFLYSGDRCLVLRHSQYETLRLYADHARRNLVQDIKKKLGDEYKEPDALFLAYDGQPILKKRKVRKRQSIKGTAAEKEIISFTARGEMEHHSSNSTESTAKNGDVCEDTSSRIHKHEGSGGASFDNKERNESKDVVTSSISLGGNVLVHTSSTHKNESEEFNQIVAHKEGCHATDFRSGEEESMFAKVDTKLLNEVFVRKYEEVKQDEDLQEKNLQFNQCETYPVSIGKLDDKCSKCGTDEEMMDENISDVTNSDSFGTTKENYSKTNDGSLSGNNKDSISHTGTGTGILTKIEIASDMTRENISKTAFDSSETALVSAETSLDKLDCALVYACITSIIHDKIGEKGCGADLDLELD